MIATARAKSRNDSGVVVGNPDVVETASFRVRHPGNREVAENIAKGPSRFGRRSSSAGAVRPPARGR